MTDDNDPIDYEATNGTIRRRITVLDDGNAALALETDHGKMRHLAMWGDRRMLMDLRADIEVAIHTMDRLAAGRAA